MQRIRRIGVLSAAKTYGVLLGGVGLLIGFVISAFSLLGAGLSAMSDDPEMAGGPIMGLIFGAGAIVVAPIFYGAMGFLGGALQAWLYNLTVRFTGGVEVELSSPADMSNVDYSVARTMTGEG